MIPWDTNLDALRKADPPVARLLEELGPGTQAGEWTPARSGAPTVRRGGFQLSSTFDPAAEAARAVPRWDGDVDFALLPGFGAGYLAEAVATRYPDLPVIVAEQDPRWFAEVLAHRDLSSLLAHPFFTVILGPDPRAVGDFFGGYGCKTVETLDWRPLADLESGWRSAVADHLALARTRARVNLATYGKFGGLWARNLRKNEDLARSVRPVSALAGLGTGCPAVIAAAGPSLADSFGWMRTYRDRFVLVAVDTAWPSLAAQGLIPDILLVLDGQYWNARHVDVRPPETTLVVTEWTGPPRAFRLNPGRTYVAATSIPFLRRRETALWGPLGDLPTGGSVATAAWSLAMVLGCTEVAFAGLDLGYPRGQTHVPGSQFEEAIHRRSQRLFPAETLGLGLRGLAGLGLRPALDGGTVLSDPRMDLFRSWLSAEVLKRPDVRAYNLGTRGSVVPGLRRPPLNFGGTWSRTSWKNPPLRETLKPRIPDLESPPFVAFRTFLDTPRGPENLASAWSAAEGYWGSSVWNRWAGRAWNTWNRYPSCRSLRILVEVFETALTWEIFWKSEEK